MKELLLLQQFRKSLDSAIAGVSESRLEISLAAQRVSLAARIDFALEELDKLQRGEIPDYSNPDVALFYSHWYLPEQVNLAYTLSARLLEKRRHALGKERSLQLVDFGARTGAMALGLTLAIAQGLPSDKWPEMIAVYQIDRPAMLDVGDEIWGFLSREASTQEELHDLAAVMSHTLFERVESVAEWDADRTWNGAERWLSGLHVVYEETLRSNVTAYSRIRHLIRPHVSIVTAPKFKESHIENALPVNLLLDGTAGKTRDHRASIASILRAELSVKAQRYLRNDIQWASRYGGKQPVAGTAVREWEDE